LKIDKIDEDYGLFSFDNLLIERSKDASTLFQFAVDNIEILDFADFIKLNEKK
jgi:hypothetical protein